MLNNHGKINGLLKRTDKWLPAVFFCCVLGLYLTMMAHFVFVDELDVFYGGYNIARSGDIYRFYPSQHMPFSYYLALPGALLGARTVWQFRLYFYVLLSALWTGMYIRYRKQFSRPALILMPLLYIVQLRMHELARTMVSDHWQGIGLVIILLELLWFTDTKKITAGMAGMISLGIVLSFGTTFLSAYPLLIVFLGVLAMQAVRIRRKEAKLADTLREDGRLTLICLCPFVLLGAWYLLSGNLANAFGGAYELNTTIYSKYLNGFGSSAGGAFLAVFPNWIRYQAKVFSYLNGEGWRWALQIVLQTAALVIFVISLLKKQKIIAGLTFLLAVLLAGVRAFDGFHGAPYMAVCCIPMAFCLAGAAEYYLEKKCWRRAAPAALALALAAAFILPEAGMVRELSHAPRLLRAREYRESNRDILEILAEPGERIHTDDLYYSGLTIMKNGLRLTEGSLGAGNPWFYEYYGENELEVLKENPARILVMDLKGEVWGYRLRDYAPDLVDYVEANYTLAGPNLYVRNDAYPAALAKLREAGYGTRLVGRDFAEENRLGARMTDDTVCDQQFTAAGSRMTGVLVRFANDLDQNRAGATVQLIGENGEVIAGSTLPREEIKDNFYTRFALQADTEPGACYTLRITTDGTTPEGDRSLLSLYCYPGAEEAGASLDGEPQAFSWAVAFEYDAE